NVWQQVDRPAARALRFIIRNPSVLVVGFSVSCRCLFTLRKSGVFFSSEMPAEAIYGPCTLQHCGVPESRDVFHLSREGETTSAFPFDNNLQRVCLNHNHFPQHPTIKSQH